MVPVVTVAVVAVEVSAAAVEVAAFAVVAGLDDLGWSQEVEATSVWQHCCSYTKAAGLERSQRHLLEAEGVPSRVGTVRDRCMRVVVEVVES